MIPYRTRQSVKRTLSWLLERAHAGSRDSIPSVVCLCYHSVNEHESPASIHPHIFRTQLSYLREHSFQFLTMGELVNRLRLGVFPASPTAVITFDDGFEDNRTKALPILLELGITATFFICTGLVTRDERTLHRFGQWTGHPYKYLDPAQISDLRQAGMEIGAHTHSHRNL